MLGTFSRLGLPTVSALLLAGGLWALGCSSSKGGPGLGESTGGSGGGDGGLADGGAPGGDAPGDSAASLEGGDAPADADTADGPPPPPPPTCNRETPWVGPGLPLPSASTDGDDLLGSITPDELAIAWMSTSGDAKTVYYAERPMVSAPFGEKRSVGDLDDGVVAGLDRVALSPTGLRLILVDASGRDFLELGRASRSDAFSTAADKKPFANIVKALAEGQRLGDPVVSMDDLTLFYSRYTPAKGGEATIAFATRAAATDAWTPAGELTGDAFRSTADGKRRRPTGVSRDTLTLFFWDEPKSIARAAWRTTTATPFDSFVDLSDRVGLQPNAACNALYFCRAVPPAAAKHTFVLLPG